MLFKCFIRIILFNPHTNDETDTTAIPINQIMKPGLTKVNASPHIPLDLRTACLTPNE